MLLKNDFICRHGISSNELKLLALIIMVTDHVGAVLLPQYRILRYIGRLAFPIYCFLITEGVIHTHNVHVYGLRLLAFAFISEIPFDLAIHGRVLEYSDQNVFFSLFIGMAVVYISMLSGDLGLSFMALLSGIGLAMFLRVDYSAYGIIMIYCFYIFREKPLLMLVSIVLTNLTAGIGGSGSQKYAALAMLPIFLYSGEKSRRSNGEEQNKGLKAKLVQYMFYWAYPIHLLALYIIDKNGGFLWMA